MGHEQTSPHVRVMSALPPIADVPQRRCDVQKVPIADIRDKEQSAACWRIAVVSCAS